MIPFATYTAADSKLLNIDGLFVAFVTREPCKKAELIEMPFAG